MDKRVLMLSLALAAMTGCGTINQMNDLVNASTCSIDANREAVERSTAVIRRNGELVSASSRAIEENRQHLEEATK